MKMLKILRLQKGDRLKDLANLLGVTESAYHHYESGRVKLDLESAKKLSEYYGVTMDVLLDPHEYDESYVYTKLIKDQPVAEFEDEASLKQRENNEMWSAAMKETVVPFVDVTTHVEYAY